MKLNTGTLGLRAISVLPVAIALVVLAFAALFTLFAVRESLWILGAVCVALVACAVILLRTSYLAWRRPTPATVREVFDWTSYALIGLAVVAFERLNMPGREWVAWGAFVASLIALTVVEPWLRRFLFQKLFPQGEGQQYGRAPVPASGGNR
ncbi:MAG: hypothetical protein J0M24_20255 [Verrucomicrobia bacterium]|nr:hypothetical protein [Verrucomicrobiota bacterium]